MNNKILILTVLLTNIAFGGVVVVKPIRTNPKIKINPTFTNNAINKLYDKGLQRDVAIKKINSSLLHDATQTEFMARNLLQKFPTLTKEHITNHISNAALFNKNVDFSSYENLLALVQKNASFYLDKKSLTLLQNVANENKSLFV